MAEPTLDPPSEVHCPECADCVMDEPDKCDWCPHEFHGEKVCMAMGGECCCEGGTVQLCDDDSLHELCKACWRKWRDSMDPRV